MSRPTDPEIRAAREAAPKTRARDLAHQLGLREGELVAAHLGHGATRIAAHPDRLIPALEGLGPVMALTRNDSAVIEQVDVYRGYRGGPRAGVVIHGAFDFRVMTPHWVHAFAVEEGDRHSVQVFDAAGDAVHKVYLREGSDRAAWAPMVAALAEPAAPLIPEPRPVPEAARAHPERRDELRDRWQALTDTHQFAPMVSRLGMNRLGAYRLAGADLARPLAPDAIRAALHGAAEGGFPIMIFVGNRGMIQIHTGPVHRVVEMGPWINILDPGLDLHLRMDHIAEAYAVTKPTKRGAARSVECFDAEGRLIAQLFGVLRDGDTATQPWAALVDSLPGPIPEAAE